MDVFEAMETCRAMRYLKPDPVPDELVRKLVHAATRASSPGNSQGWEFIVIREAATKQRLGEAVAKVMRPILASRTDVDDPVKRRMYAGVAHLVDHFAQVPVWILIAGRVVYPPERPQASTVWGSVYPAGQNLIVAARALGLGTTFTTFHVTAEAVFRETLGLPETLRLGVFVAVGWPDRPFGPLARKPIEEVIHWERW